MNPQQIKSRLVAVTLMTASACGTFALFGSVPVLAKIGDQAPFSIGKIEAFLFQQADLPVPASASSTDLDSAQPSNSHAR
jgi:hypothetical protein